MALTRSASGPGLSINTNSANSLFGSSTTPASAGMFGSTQASKPGGLFGSTTTAPQTGGLFGSTTSSAPAASGLFGSAASSAPQSGGLFGSAPAQPSGGLFGSTPATTQPATGGLFGGAPATTQPASGGLFGNTQSQAQPASGGLFGNAAATTTQPASGGLFGSATTQAQPSGGLFGGAASTGAGGLFGGQAAQPKPAGGSLLTGFRQSAQQAQPQQSSMFGAAQNRAPGAPTQQQTVPGVRIDLSNVRGTTRFEDLHDDLKNEIQKIDNMILTQISFHEQCQAFMNPHEAQLNQIPHDVEFCRRKLIGMENGQDSDVQSIAIAAQQVRQDADHASLSFRAIDNLKLPAQYHNSGMWQSNESRDKNNEEPQDIVGFFSMTADDLNNTLSKYQRHINEIEQHLKGVEVASAQQINALVARKHGSSRAQTNPVEDLTAVLRDFEGSLFGVADRVGGARVALREAQSEAFGELQGSGRSDGYRASVNGRRGIY